MGAREDEPERALSVSACLSFCFFTPHYRTSRSLSLFVHPPPSTIDTDTANHIV